MAALPMHIRGNFWIGIDKDTKKVDHDTVTISKRAKQEAEWFCHQPDTSLVIRFTKPKGSPFQDSEFVVPASGSVLSGPPRDDAPVGTYKYEVYKFDSEKKQSGERLLDPQIIIDP